jgi:beta-lactam-binding protein with PASTA domain
MTAEDVVHSFRTIQNAPDGSVYKNVLNYVADCTKTGDYTVIFTFHENFSSNLNALCFPVISAGYHNGDNDIKSSVNQTPVGNAIVPNNATVILYLGAEKSQEPCKVPIVIGMTAAKANQALTNAGLIMRVTGVTDAGSGNVYATSQDVAAGDLVPAGTVVTVRFSDNSSLD